MGSQHFDLSSLTIQIFSQEMKERERNQVESPSQLPICILRYLLGSLINARHRHGPTCALLLREPGQGTLLPLQCSSISILLFLTQRKHGRDISVSQQRLPLALGCGPGCCLECQGAPDCLFPARAQLLPVLPIAAGLRHKTTAITNPCFVNSSRTAASGGNKNR